MSHPNITATGATEHLREELDEFDIRSTRFAGVLTRWLAYRLRQELDERSTMRPIDPIRPARINRLIPLLNRRRRSMRIRVHLEMSLVLLESNELKRDNIRLRQRMQTRIARYGNEIDPGELYQLLDDFEDDNALWERAQEQQRIDGLPCIRSAFHRIGEGDIERRDLPSMAARMLDLDLCRIDSSIIARWAPIARRLQRELEEFANSLDRSLMAMNEVIYYSAANVRLEGFIDRFDQARARANQQGQMGEAGPGDEEMQGLYHFLEGEAGFY